MESIAINGGLITSHQLLVNIVEAVQLGGELIFSDPRQNTVFFYSRCRVSDCRYWDYYTGLDGPGVKDADSSPHLAVGRADGATWSEPHGAYRVPLPANGSSDLIRLVYWYGGTGDPPTTSGGVRITGHSDPSLVFGGRGSGRGVSVNYRYKMCVIIGRLWQDRFLCSDSDKEGKVGSSGRVISRRLIMACCADLWPKACRFMACRKQHQYTIFYAMGHNPWDSGLFSDIDFGMWVCFLKNIQIIDGTLALLKFGRGVLEGCES